MSYKVLPLFFFLSISLSLAYLFFHFPPYLCLLVLFPPSLLLLATAGSLLGHSCCQLSFIYPSSSIFKSSFPNHFTFFGCFESSFFLWCLFFFFLFFWGCSLYLDFSSFLLLLGTLFSVLLCVM